MSPDDCVTIIISAYGRPMALSLALESIYQQTHRNWQTLIICDHCPAEFKTKLNIKDKRVEWINLPQRFGNQYGPNSIGISLAESAFIAFMNHDDIWLSDHLETALKTLHDEESQFYLGKTAFSHAFDDDKDALTLGRWTFSELNHPEAIWRCLHGPNSLYEPVSAWVIETATAKFIGHFSPPDTTNYTPVMEWLQRALQKGTKLSFGKKVTSLKFDLRTKKPTTESGLYEYDHSLSSLFDFFYNTPVEIIRNSIDEDLIKSELSGNRVRRHMGRHLNVSLFDKLLLVHHKLWLASGIRLFPSKQTLRPGKEQRNALRTLSRRTGEKMSAFPNAERINRVIKTIINRR
ncbi:hypothetical protein BOW53_00930 [Solemya pervernicosa gill symbiont]|uniref:Glycosyltransferase 2-like domain-containing protein n=2 Tax=Gammaproteobacteria incertae sedis TaxID=118884 RepID=A0A1T2LAP2_9GAMM|nr:glycosyltransferase family A protein [Candidatus Reidiella endopervernicosa]OOZ42175.1 hypothetical protein BOW53_00930 [Solemya pervernicosa gill symbiont]QKQ27256.1 glycosyltransferase family 2 protein [Candidatus Reidiella endopervernicosa]